MVRTYAGAADDAELLRVNNAAFSWHPEQGVGPARISKNVGVNRGSTQRDCSWRSTRLPGFAGLPLDEGASVSPGLGEVYVVRIDPTAQGRGLGRALTLIGVRHLANRLSGDPDAAVMLYVESDNGAALRTYENLGFSVASIDTAYSPAWKPLEFTSSSPPMGFPSTRAAYLPPVGIEHQAAATKTACVAAIAALALVGCGTDDNTGGSSATSRVLPRRWIAVETRR